MGGGAVGRAYWLPAHALGSHWRVPLPPRARAPLGVGGRGARTPPHPSRPAAAGSRCPPGRFQCHPGAFCFPAEWRCDGHPDCEDEEDERGCGTATPDGAWVTPPRSSGVPPAGGAGRGERGVSGEPG